MKCIFGFIIPQFSRQMWHVMLTEKLAVDHNAVLKRLWISWVCRICTCGCVVVCVCKHTHTYIYTDICDELHFSFVPMYPMPKLKSFMIWWFSFCKRYSACLTIDPFSGYCYIGQNKEREWGKGGKWSRGWSVRVI